MALPLLGIPTVQVPNLAYVTLSSNVSWELWLGLSRAEHRAVFGSIQKLNWLERLTIYRKREYIWS